MSENTFIIQREYLLHSIMDTFFHKKEDIIIEKLAKLGLLELRKTASDEFPKLKWKIYPDKEILLADNGTSSGLVVVTFFINKENPLDIKYE